MKWKVKRWIDKCLYEKNEFNRDSINRLVTISGLENLRYLFGYIFYCRIYLIWNKLPTPYRQFEIDNKFFGVSFFINRDRVKFRLGISMLERKPGCGSKINISLYYEMETQELV